jgi:hypothetical protein
MTSPKIAVVAANAHSAACTDGNKRFCYRPHVSRLSPLE